MPPPDAKTRPRVLDVACGPNKRTGAVGFDLFPVPGVDLLANFDGPHLPFRDDSFDEVYASHVVEHAGSVVSFLNEIHRVARPGALVHIVTPHYSWHGSWSDPTHRWHLNTFSFQYFAPIRGERYWYTRLELRQRALHIELARIWKYLGLQWLVNRFLWARRFWEFYLSFIMRGKQMEFTFEVVK